MHVDSITLSQQGTSVKQLTSNIKIVDARLDPVRSAMVNFTVKDTNGTQWVRSANTSPTGLITFVLSGVTVGHTYTLIVDNVSRTDWIYDSDSNYESSKSYTIT
jgi:hypothetical protein